MFRNSIIAIVIFAAAGLGLLALWAGTARNFPTSYAMLTGFMFGGVALVVGLDLADAVLWRARRLGAGVFIRPQADGYILTICRYTPLAYAAFAVFASGMLAVVAYTIAALVTRSLPGRWLEWSLVSLTVVSGLAVYAWHRYWRQRGANDLIIDGAMRTVLLPPGPNRKEAISLGMAEITDVDVIVWEQEVRHQYGSTTVYSYVPTVVYRSQLGAWKNAHLVEWRDQGKAEALAKWLRRELGVG